MDESRDDHPPRKTFVWNDSKEYKIERLK